MPRFQFFCPQCNAREDRFVTNDEKHQQTCRSCGTSVVYEFVATRQKPIVYANDSRHPRVFTGPKQRERYIRDHNLVELGSESKDTIRKESRRLEAEAEAKREAEMEQEVHAVLDELGDAGLYQSVPKHVAKRMEREASDSEPDLTGAGVGSPPDVD